MSVFIHAHACMLPEKFILDRNDTLYFKSNSEEICTFDSTGIDVIPANYPFRVAQAGPTIRNGPNDYSINFYDEAVIAYGLNTFGAFYQNENGIWINLIPSDMLKESGHQILLSVLINELKTRFGPITNFYLNICRAPCHAIAGGKRRTSRKGRKTRKSRKNRKSKKSYFRKR